MSDPQDLHDDPGPARRRPAGEGVSTVLEIRRAPRRKRKRLPVLWMAYVAARAGRVGLSAARIGACALLGLIGLVMLVGGPSLLYALLRPAVPADETPAIGVPDERAEPDAATPPPPPPPPPPARQLDARNIRASNWYEHPSDPWMNAPSKAFDGMPSTPWITDPDLPASGQWIEATVEGATTLRRVWLTTGYDRVNPSVGDLFPMNGHAQKVSLVVDERPIASLAIERDQRTAAFEDLEVPLRAEGSRIRLVFDAVFDGTASKVLCITEVEIEGS